MAPHLLMCRPDFYGIHYEINPWMNTRRQADHAVAVTQWQKLRKAIIAAGAEVSEIEPVEGLPDLVFTANAALIFERRAVISRFKHPQRQGEEPHFRNWFAQRGWDTLDSPEGCSFEGAGDALFCGDTLLAGYRLRSDARGHQQIAARLGVRVLPVELIDPYYYHLDTCFCPLTEEEAIWFPAAFDDYGRKVIETNVRRLIAVEESEARNFACNAVVIGRTVITNTDCPILHQQLGEMGFAAAAVALGEFVKAGGSAKCLTLRLDGEDAAAWRAAASAPVEPAAS